VRRCRVSGLRPVAAPFVAAAPAGARVRTRLRVSARDGQVLAAAGTHLGSLTGRDLAVAVAAADGNVLGTPATIPLDLAGRPAATRDGRLRAAISALIATAKEHGARAIVIEDLDFAEARSEGRERHGNRPSRGRRGRAGPAPGKPATPRGPRQPPGTKTGRPHRIRAGNQATQDRPGPPTSQDHVLLVQ
jgi:predicted nucleic acid-binding protein